MIFKMNVSCKIIHKIILNMDNCKNNSNILMNVHTILILTKYTRSFYSEIRENLIMSNHTYIILVH